jgi:hypothetical protein
MEQRPCCARRNARACSASRPEAPRTQQTNAASAKLKVTLLSSLGSCRLFCALLCVCVRGAHAQVSAWAYLYVVCSSEAGCFVFCNNRRGRWRRALSCCAPDALWRAGIGRSACSAAAAPVAQTAPARSPETPRASGVALRRNRTRRSFARASAYLPHSHRGASGRWSALKFLLSTYNVNRSLPSTLFDAKTDDGTREAPRIAWTRCRERFCRTKRHRRRSSRPARDLQNHSDRLGAVGFQARSCAVTSVA